MINRILFLPNEVTPPTSSEAFTVLKILENLEPPKMEALLLIQLVIGTRRSVLSGAVAHPYTHR